MDRERYLLKNWAQYKSGVPKVTKNGQSEPVPKLTKPTRERNEEINGRKK